jgi:ubiquinone/menaquinone biosynthesis C-methylase UbiE
VTAEERLAYAPTSELWGEHRSRYRFAARYVAGMRVLDVASGAGFGMQMLRQTGCRVVGLDYDSVALREARQLESRSALVHGDATRLPLADESVDAVVSFETLEHVPDAEAMLREIKRVVAPGGHLVLSTPNRAFGPPARHANPFHIKEFTADELRTLLERYFAQVALYGQRPSHAYRYVPFLMIEPHSEPRALAWKAMLRLPYGVRERLAKTVSGHSFYPGEHDYVFEREVHADSHALVAVAR